MAHFANKRGFSSALQEFHEFEELQGPIVTLVQIEDDAPDVLVDIPGVPIEHEVQHAWVSYPHQEKS